MSEKGGIYFMEGCLVSQIRVYRYSTVVYAVEGIGLSNRLVLSLQYRCKNNGQLPPSEAETPAFLFNTAGYASNSFVTLAICFNTRNIYIQNREKTLLYDNVEQGSNGFFILDK
jgi:hypothetical protein